jgi:hypothetical protein
LKGNWLATEDRTELVGGHFSEAGQLRRSCKASVTAANQVDSLKPLVDAQKRVALVVGIVTGTTGAKLWAVGKFMVVQIDCNDLNPQAKYELLTSTREHAKETPVKKMILEELVRRLGFDKRLEELNVQLAAADIKRPDDKKWKSSGDMHRRFDCRTSSSSRVEMVAR